MFNIGIPELILILMVVLLVFGPGKLPEVGKAIGKGLNEFRRGMDGTAAKEEAITIEAKPVEKKNDIETKNS